MATNLDVRTELDVAEADAPAAEGTSTVGPGR
jgi:hypothetical protein